VTSEVWSRETADQYDESSAFMFSPAVLEPTVACLTALACGGPVLELAIGTGRVALPLAAQGLSVSGIELSQPMVDVLRSKPGGSSLPVVVGDMSSAVVPGEFSLVYVVWNSISNLLTQEAQVACFQNAACHLIPGGRFVNRARGAGAPAAAAGGDVPALPRG
jgi:SAM-dependent methyltransferase